MDTPETDLDRRRFLAGTLAAGAAGAAAALPLRPVRALADAVADRRLAPFLHGVASGDPLADRVVLWTRVDGTGTVPVRWTVALDPAMRRVVRTGTTTAGPARDHCVKVDVAGLQPRTTYYYAFEARGVRSMVGRTLTAPARGQAVERLRFAVTSCAKYDQGFFNAYARMAEADVDVVLHLGDYLYEEPQRDEPVRPLDDRDETRTLAEYRTRHALYKTDPDLQRLHQQHPMVATWDDHESANNAWVDGANRHEPERDGPFSVRKAAAQRAYDEWMPLRLPVAGDPSRIYRALPYGDLVEMVVIDTRLEGRSKQLEGAQNDGELFSTDPRSADPARQMYSPTQRRFIEQRLAGSPAQWKLLLNQVLVSQLKAQDLPADVSRALAAIGQAGAPTEGANLATDIWDGYEAERDRLLGFLRSSRTSDVVVLTGDIHASFANDLTEDPFDVLTPPAAVEFVTTSVTSSNFDETFGSPPRTTSIALERSLMQQNPSTKYVELDSNGWTLVDVTRDRVQAEYLFVSTLAERGGTQRLDATWQVRRGANSLSAGGPQTSARPGRPAAAPAPAVVRTGATPAPSPSRAPAGSRPAGQGLPSTGSGTRAAAAAALLAGGAALLRRRLRGDGAP